MTDSHIFNVEIPFPVGLNSWFIWLFGQLNFKEVFGVINDLENPLFPIGGWEWASVQIIIFKNYITGSHDILVRIS